MVGSNHEQLHWPSCTQDWANDTKSFVAGIEIERGKAFDGVCPARSLQCGFYLTLSFIAKEFFMAQLVV